LEIITKIKYLCKLINIDDIGGYSSISKLRDYDGKNPYIKKLKKKLLKDGKITLTDFQKSYILDNYDKEPMLINKIVNISEYLGEALQKQEELSFKPERILIEYILADSEKTYHVYGKLTRKQEKSKIYFLPKNQVLDDPYFEQIDIDVDFEKYEKLDKFINMDGSIGRKVFDKQKEGVKFLLTRNGAILADQMGAGKTIQTIISAIESGSKKVLIVCPTSAKLNWERELHYMQEYDTAVVSGSKYKTAKYTIINFDILKNFHTLKGEEQDGIPPSRDLVNSKFDLCIIDEAHNLRNHKSIRGAIMRELCVDYGIEKTWLLTGTPVANRPMDFYNLLSLIKSPIVKDWKHYVTRYCEGKQIKTKTKGGKLKKIWLTDGASNLDELSMKSRNILLRRLTHEFSDMPDKTITPLYFDMDKNQESEYYSLWDTYLEERKKLKKRGKVEKELVELSLLRRFIANETIPKTIELVDEIINEGNKVVIFTCFTDEIKTLSEYYGKNCVTHYGEMNNTEKQKSVDRFQDEGGPMVFIGNIISAGVAITLTRAHYMVFNSFDWVPGNIEQCEFRCYRIGQKNNVKIYYNLFNDTIVTRMWETIKYKQSIIDTILNNSTANETNYIEDAIDYITKNENE
jgi:SWI/SNF-related matrix-associated actin-dependent regulator 1 of chromatin subfamily A